MKSYLIIISFSACFITSNTFTALPNDDLAERAIVARIAQDETHEAWAQAIDAKSEAFKQESQAFNDFHRSALRVHNDRNSDEYKAAAARLNAAAKASSDAMDDTSLAYYAKEAAESSSKDAYIAYRKPTQNASIEVQAAAHRAHEEAVAQRKLELAAARLAALNLAENKSAE